MAGRSTARLRAPAMDHAGARGEGRRVRWAAVDEQGRAVGQHDVGRAAGGDPDRFHPPGRLAAVPPDRLPAPGVVVVGPDQEVEALQAELEDGGELVDRPVVTLGCPQGIGVGRQLDHHRPALEPGQVERVHHRGRLAQLGLADGEPRARRPRVGWGGTGGHDHARVRARMVRGVPPDQPNERLRQRVLPAGRPGARPGWGLTAGVGPGQIGGRARPVTSKGPGIAAAPRR